MNRVILKLVLSGALCLSLVPSIAWAEDPLDSQVLAEGQDSPGGEEALEGLDGLAGLEPADDPSDELADEPIGGSDDGDVGGSEDPVLEEGPEAPEGIEPGEADSAEVVQEEDPEVSLQEAAKPYSVTYRAHVAKEGWQGWTKSSKTAGTTGRSLAVEALQIKLEGTGYSGSVEYVAHVSGVGWQSPVRDGKIAGTTGQARRTEAVRISLTGEVADHYSVRYRVHSATFGWLAWACDGADAGSAGYGYRMEAVQIELVAKGSAQSDPGAFKKKPMDISVSAHSASVGWKTAVAGGETAGTTGRALRLEALRVSVVNPDFAGSVEYRAHVQSTGWQSWKKDGAVAGTTGRGLRIEAVEMRLTGALAAGYDVYYRVHASNIGWMGWACNGETAGMVGFSSRAEAVQVKLVKKGGKTPGPTAGHTADVSYSSQGSVAKKGWLSEGSGMRTVGTTGQGLQLEQFRLRVASSGLSGSVEYRAHVGNVGWQVWDKNGADAGAAGKQVEAVQIRLTGDLSKYFDVYYRAHSANWGWLGWAKNGASAGTTKLGLRMEAFQIAVVAKGAPAPGTTKNSYREYSSGDAWLDAQLASIASSRGYSLKACFDYVAGYRYVNMSKYPSGNWAPPFAKEMLKKGGGNCYRYAALFCMLAREMGYNANVVSGWVPTYGGGQAPHGWVEIYKDGKTYLCDPDMAHENPSRNWYMVTYANAPTDYHRW